MGEADPRLAWLEERVVATLRGVKPDKFRQLLATDAGRTVQDFLNNPKSRRLFFVDSPTAKELLVSDVPPVGKGLAGAKKFMYFIKSRQEALTLDNLERTVACGDVGGAPLEHLYRTCADVFLPILSNPSNQEGWPEVISREVMESFHKLIANVYVTIGQSQGRTLLPLPPLDLASAERTARDKDRVHALETAVVTWTRQIRNVLKTDPEQVLKTGEHPGPLAELEFWRSKAANLNSVQEQLHGERVRKVVRVLDMTKSTYFPAFNRLQKEVATACAEANDNAKYLKTLERAFMRLHETQSFQDIAAHFRPIVHMLMLVWKHSRHYNTPSRLVILVREICNEIIDQARRYINAREIFQIDAADAVDRLMLSIRVCGTLKSVYFDYKSRVATECPTNPWRIQNTALFPRLDAFLERLHDLLDLCRTVVQFAKLERIEIGGNKGRTLSASVFQIYSDFVKTLEVFRMVPYDVLDVELKQFDDEFYAFRVSIKELERRLASVLNQGFDDCATIFGAFKLIESFEALLEREFIQADLERKHVELVRAYGKDLREVNEIFNRQKDLSAEGRYLERSGPPLYANMPPCSGALYWVRGLIDRIEEPMTKLKQMMRLMLESDDAKDVNKQHAVVLGALRDFEAAQYEEWASGVHVVAYEKLKQPLLVRDTQTQLLTVNFDPALVCLLREVGYLVRLGMDIPKAADELFKSSETFRIQIGNLQMITSRYNNMLQTMLEVEEPLLAGLLRQIDKVLEKGLHHLTWRSHAINDFIREVVVLVREASDTLGTLKGNMSAIEDILTSWAEAPLLRRRLPKTYSPAELEEEHETTMQQRYTEVAEGGREVQKLLMASNRVLRVSKGAPMWRTYVEFINDIVVEGLARTVANSLCALCTQVDPAEISRSELLPLLEVQLELAAPDVAFSPDLGAAGGETSVHNRVQAWIKSFFHVTRLARRLDRADGDFLKEVEENEEVRYYTHRIREHITANEKECARFCKPFLEHRELWTQDIGAAVGEFLRKGPGSGGGAGAAGSDAKAAQPVAGSVSAAARSAHGASVGGGGGTGTVACADLTADGTGEDSAADGAANGGGSGGSRLAQPTAVVRAKLPTVAQARLEPRLEAFDVQVAHYKAVQDDVMALPGSANQGWLRIDAKPVKQALSTWVTKWMFAYTHHLQTRVVSALEELHEFMREVKQGLREPPEAGDVAALVRAMTHVRDVRVCTDEVDGMFEPLKATVGLLRRYGIALPDSVAEQLEAAPFVWEDTKKATFSAREELGPAQSLQAEKIKEDADVFASRLRDFRSQFSRDAPFEWPQAVADFGLSGAGADAVDAAYSSLDSLHVAIQSIEAEAAVLSEQEELFDLTVHSWREIDMCRQELLWLKLVWDHAALIGNAFSAWRSTTWTGVDVDAMVYEAHGLERALKGLVKHVRSWGVYAGLWALLQEMTISLPLVSDLRDEAMRDRHWKKLARICGRTFAMDSRTTLDDLLRLQLHLYADAVAETVQQAREELKIDRQLARIDAAWMDLALTYEPFKATGVLVIRAPDAVYEALDDHEVALQSMMANRFMGFFEAQILSWKARLAAVRATLDRWLEVQRAWCSLESIYLGSEDIREQLPEDAKRFDMVDADFREQMTDASATPNPLEACLHEGRHETLVRCLAALEQCTRSLGEYLESKRKKFPRFYMISSADLVDILSKGRHAPSVQEHFAKLTDSIAAIQWRVGDDGMPSPTALAMRSSEGETVQFKSPLSCEGMQAEEWLAKLVAHVQATLREELRRCVDAFVETTRERWLFDFCAQLSVTASQVWWTADITSAFERLEQGNEGALKDYLAQCATGLQTLTTAINRPDLSRGDRSKLITLITVDVHARDVVVKLVDTGVETAAAFVWQQQLRYRWDDDRADCSISIADAEFGYCYEYVGNTGRLVITPLTDRCYMTLTQALKLVLGGAPTGPAGTGKTETVKDLGRGLAVWVIVQNCSDQMTAKVTATLFSGLAQTGTWGCLDEFNRIPVEVLSVAAGQFSAVLDAIRAGKERFSLEEEMIKLVPTMGAFVTMNPGYAGRSELPENLKALFRPCAMVAPDFDKIVEISLAAEGFQEAKNLAHKFVELFRLSDELLFRQHHYDWGLRAMKGILRIAGGLKRAEPDKTEAQILMRALRDVNLPKLVLTDHGVFLGLVEDLFPRVECASRPSAEVTQAVRTLIAEPTSALQAEDAFVRKCVSLDEILTVRHSVFILGPAGSGKSAIWRTLNLAYTHLAQLSTATAGAGAALYTAVNPKAVSPDELYGFVHPTTKEPSDGILARVMREYAHLDSAVPKWVVLDGDIDAGWIESMNTVMDDNKVLTLVTNERIPLTPSMRLLFEVSHLRNASPATVSRAGVLFINESDIGWRPFVTTWVDQMGQTHPPALLEQLFDAYAVPALEASRRERWQHVTPLPEMCLVQSLCLLLEGLLAGADVQPAVPPTAADKELYEALFQFATVWTVGGALSSDKAADHRRAFSEWWHSEVGKTGGVHVPDGDGLVFDYFVDVQARRFVHWREAVGAYSHVTDVTFANIVVPTVDTARLGFLCDTLIPRRKPVMLAGGAGTAKTTIICDALRSLPDDALSYTVNFNSYTDAAALQPMLEQPLEKKTGSIFGPPGTKRLVYFVDDFNMPAPDRYGTQSAVELLRQLRDYGGIFDLRTHRMKRVQGTQLLAAMNPTAGSFAIVDRMQRHFATFACPFPEAETVHHMYLNVLAGHLATFPVELGRLAEPIVAAALALHREMVDGFLPTAAKFHYQWTLRELARVIEGLCLATPDFFVSPVLLARLWAHESRRVYGDRLVMAQDRARFAETLTRVAKNFFEEFSQEELQAEPLIFASFTGATGGHDEGGLTRPYLPVSDSEKLRKLLESQLRLHNESHPRMDLVLFEHAMDHICRISRILDRPRGNALLVGVGGSGKQSLTRLAAFIGGFSLVQIAITATYDLSDFRSDLLQLYARAGLKGEAVLLLLTDRQIVEERMLMYLNDCLATGSVPDLYTPEDRDSIINAVRNEVKAAGLLDSHHNCWEYFVDKVRANLHLVLCFSPIGDAFRARCRKFPALTTCCTIDYFTPWPADALISVASRYLADVDLGAEEALLRENLAHHMAYVHECVAAQAQAFLLQERRHVHTTPKSFLDLIALYKVQLLRARARLDTQMARLEQGLVKLRSSAAQVAEMQTQLRDEQVVVEQKKQETDGLLVQVGQESAVADEQGQVAEAEEREVATVQNEVAASEAQCSADLAAAEPAIKKAEAALDVLDKKALTELKSLANPPKDVLAVCQAVMYMTAKPKTNLKKLDVSWNGVKKAMGSVESYLSMLQSFERDNIPAENKDMVRRFTGPPDRPDPGFNGDAMKSKSVAAAGLCDWVCNMMTYHDMFLDIEPKRQLLKEAQAKLADANKKLASVREHVGALEERKAVLQGQLVRATEEKNRLVEQAQRTAKRLNLAERLVNGLKDENDRWGAQIEVLKERKTLLVGDIMVAAAFIAYIGPFNETFRRTLVHAQWIPDMIGRDIPMRADDDGAPPSPVTVLADSAQIAAWRSEGLPSDRLSIENGAIVTSCVRWPLLIDPQLQGVNWLKRHAESEGLNVTQLTHRNYLERVRRAMEEGAPVLIENIPETLDAVLEPVISRATMRKGRKTVIRLGEREVEVLTASTRMAAGGGAGATGGGAVGDIGANGGSGASASAGPNSAGTGTGNGGGVGGANGGGAGTGGATGASGAGAGNGGAVATTSAAGLAADAPLFRLYLQTRLPNPHYSPEVAAQTTIINFSVTSAGLEEQLLHAVVNRERPDLEEARADLADQQNRFTIHLKELEDDLLLRLANAEGDVLSDEALITSLESTKTTVREVEEKVAEARLTSAEIDRARDTFRPVAARGSLIYFAIDSLSVIDHMYQHSLRAYNSVFHRALTRAPAHDEAAGRIAHLLDSVTYTCYAHVTRGLYERHRLIFATKLALDVLTGAGELSTEDAELLVRAPKVTDKANALASWLPDSAWHGVLALAEHKPQVFASLPADMEASWKRWREWADAETPELEPLPQEWKRLSAFHRLVLMRALRPDRMLLATEHWVRDALGPAFAEAVPFDLEVSFEETSPSVPLFFLLSPGVDPTGAVRALGRRLGFDEESGRFATVSLGQGQEPAAEKAIDRAHVEGGWVMLQNIELCARWLPKLERQLDALSEGAHRDMRVMLTAMPSSLVPAPILQRSVKCTNEPPSGLKANMLRAYASLDESAWDGSSRQAELKSIVFALCFFHSAACERRKFGPIGWNRPYPFSLNDLGVCVTVAAAYLEASASTAAKVPWDDVRYIVGELMYGGHITDPWDRRLCQASLSACLREELLEGLQLFPKFEAPPPGRSHKEYLEYVEDHLESETPAAFGLHPNSEILVMTRRTAELFDAIAELQPRAAAVGTGMALQEKAKRHLDDLLERMPEQFATADLEERMPPEDQLSPFFNVFLQECTRMNTLLTEMQRSLSELDQGLKGDLSVSEVMDQLMVSLHDNKVPTAWEAVAWPSLRSLSTWFLNVLDRHRQLSDWTADLLLPRVTWISGLVNPQAFLTAVMQVTARKNESPLDKLTIAADVTKKGVDEIDGPTREGSYVHGLFLEGAKWDVAGGVLEDAALKELHQPMPVMLIRGAAQDKVEGRDTFQCPVYQTQMRGPTYVFTAGLRTKVPPNKWVMAGVAMVFDVAP